MPVSQYLQKTKAIADELAAAGKTLSPLNSTPSYIGILELIFTPLLLLLTFGQNLFLFMNYMGNLWLMRFYSNAIMKSLQQQT